MKAVIRVIGVLVFAMLVASLLLEPAAGQPASARQALPAPVVDQPEEEAVSSEMMAAPEWTRIPREWTEAEMAAAIPYPVPEQQGKGEMLVPVGNTADTQTATAPITTFASGLPEGEVGVPNDMSGLASFLSPSAPSGYIYPGPFTRYTYYGKYYKEYPYKTVGKLYFVQYGTAYVCSAASIGAYAIWTAGHCVHAGDGLSSGWSYYTMFLPG